MKNIGGYLLDNVHEKLKTNMRKDLEGKNPVLIQDGWSDIHNTPVIASSLHCNGKSYFLSAVDTGNNKQKKMLSIVLILQQMQKPKPLIHLVVTL